MRKLLVGVAAAAATLVLACPVEAAKPAPSPSLISLSGTASYGATVSFAWSSPVSDPFIHLRCSQAGTLVLEGWKRADLDDSFVLATDAWTGGGADCTATLENWDNYGLTGKIKVLASTSFHADA
jgi:hypothetical protein